MFSPETPIWPVEILALRKIANSLIERSTRRIVRKPADSILKTKGKGAQSKFLLVEGPFPMLFGFLVIRLHLNTWELSL